MTLDPLSNAIRRSESQNLPPIDLPRPDEFYCECREDYDRMMRARRPPLSREEIAEQERDCRRLASMSWADGEFYYCELMLARADAARDALGIWRNVA